MSYEAPVQDIKFVLNEIAGLKEFASSEAFDDFDLELVEPILDEAGKLASTVLSPINQPGDQEGASWNVSGVSAPKGFKEAYSSFLEGGWMGLAAPVEYGGQGLPRALALAVMEMFHGANMAFALCPMLTFGAIEALIAHGTSEQKDLYLPKLVSGEWTGTMNLTEPEAGSDVGALKTKAKPNSDGSYAISGQKIYITWGEHDLTENIIHLVLARLPDAPEGSHGVSLFLCPKKLVNTDGNLGDANSVRCISIESKLGIHGSPTCTMEYDEATAWLIGEPNKGMSAMFTMMNSARLNVGMEGVAVGEAALQMASKHAFERKQGRAAGVKGTVPIIYHSDVRRMLTSMRAKVTAARAICYACGIAADKAIMGSTLEEREKAKLREELLTPIAKAWSTDIGVEVANTGVQVHGGLGFMDGTLASQLYRDARIAPIYEGTNGIQAIDLAKRKLSMMGGAAVRDMINDIMETAHSARSTNDSSFVEIAERLEEALKGFEVATDWMRDKMENDLELGLSSATAYLEIAGDIVGGHYLTLGALEDRKNGRDKSIVIAKFFAETALAEINGRISGITRNRDAIESEAQVLYGLTV